MSLTAVDDNRLVNIVRFRDTLVDSVHDATHDIEDDDHENIIWYSKTELAEIEEENDFLVDHADMLKKRKKDDNQFCWRGLEEKRKCIQFITYILELYKEQQEEEEEQQEQHKQWDILRSACEKQSLEAREKAQKLAEKDRVDALTVYEDAPVGEKKPDD